MLCDVENLKSCKMSENFLSHWFVKVLCLLCLDYVAAITLLSGWNAFVRVSKCILFNFVLFLCILWILNM